MGALRGRFWRPDIDAFALVPLPRCLDNRLCLCNNQNEIPGVAGIHGLGLLSYYFGTMMGVKTPDWVKHAVFYQIFPDRFSRSRRLHHAPGIQFKPWGAPPSEQGFQGGDLLGIVDRLDYLEDLGVNALYLNPIFSSASNHRYHTFDYMTIDPLLGGDAAFRELLDRAHERDMRVVIDGVFNHCGRGFWPFHHILEAGKRSPYFDWFRVKGWPLRPYHSNEQQPHNYAAWWNLPALPKLNTGNPGMRRYLLEVARHWIEFGADGWRSVFFFAAFTFLSSQTSPRRFLWISADEVWAIHRPAAALFWLQTLFWREPRLLRVRAGASEFGGNYSI